MGDPGAPGDTAEHTPVRGRRIRVRAQRAHLPIERLEGLLTRESHAKLRGDTDSERYFRFVMQCIAKRGDDAEGLSQSLAVLIDEFPDASLNALMLTPTHVFGVHINSKASAPVKGLRKLFASDEEIPYRHTIDYFAMDFRLTQDAVHVISSGIDPGGGHRCPRTPQRWSILVRSS